VAEYHETYYDCYATGQTKATFFTSVPRVPTRLRMGVLVRQGLHKPNKCLSPQTMQVSAQDGTLWYVYESNIFHVFCNIFIECAISKRAAVQNVSFGSGFDGYNKWNGAITNTNIGHKIPPHVNAQHCFLVSQHSDVKLRS
jgi:hypothetical protein